MPQYYYKGYDAKGTLVKDALVAISKSAALNELNNAGLLITHIRVAYFENATIRRVNPTDFYIFNQELLALIRAGISLVESIDMCLPRSNSRLNSALKQVHQRITQGSSYSEAANAYPEVFDPIYISSIKISEQTGGLELALSQYLLYLRKKLDVLAKVKQALYYPIFLMLTLLIVMVVLFIFVVPSFSNLYDGLGAELPTATKIVLALAKSAPYFLGGLAAVGLAVYATWQTLNIPQSLMIKVDITLNRLPITGQIRLGLQRSRTFRMLDGLLSSGMPLVSSLLIAANAIPGSNLGDRLKCVSEHVEAGNSLSAALQRESVLPDQHIKMIYAGENSGSLTEMIASVSSYLEEKLEAQLKGMTALFEPVVMLVLGVFTGAIIISMYLPIFFLAEVVK